MLLRQLISGALLPFTVAIVIPSWIARSAAASFQLPHSVGITGTFSTGSLRVEVGARGLSRPAAYVYADWGIRSNVIQPGWIETDMTAAATSNPILKKAQAHVLKNTVLLRRSGKGEDIAYTARFLAGDESSYITGTDIVADGGWFSSVPYLINERSHHALSLMDKK